MQTNLEFIRAICQIFILFAIFRVVLRRFICEIGEIHFLQEIIGCKCTHNAVVSGNVRVKKYTFISRVVGSFFKVGGQDQKLFLWKQKVGGLISFFNKGKAKKWLGTCPSCPRSSYAPDFLYPSFKSTNLV